MDALHRVLGKGYDHPEIWESAFNQEVHLAGHSLKGITRHLTDRSLFYAVTHAYLDTKKIDVEEYREQAEKSDVLSQYCLHKLELTLEGKLKTLKCAFIKDKETNLSDNFGLLIDEQSVFLWTASKQLFTFD